MEKNNYNAVKCNFDVNTVKSIFNEIKLQITQHNLEIINLINDDNNTYMERTSLEKLMELIDRIQNEKWCLEKSTNKNIVDGVGNIGVIYNSNVYVFLYLCLKALKTHNNITFFKTTPLHKLEQLLIHLVTGSAKKHNYFANMNIVQLDDIKKITSYDDVIDKYICVGERKLYDDYYKYVSKEVVYSAYGTIAVYMDDKTLKDELLKLDDFVFENDLKLNFYTNKDVDKVVNLINDTKEHYCCVIFSKDIEKVKSFINQINADKIFVNKNPFKEYYFELDDVHFIKIKKVYI